MSLIDLHLLHDELLKKTKLLDFQDVILPKEFQVAYQEYLSDKKPNGYQSIVWAKYSSKIITSSGKFIYATNYWFYIASELAEFTKVLNDYQVIFRQAFDGADSNKLKEIATSLRDGGELEPNEVLDALTPEDKQYFKVFMSDYSKWGGGKTIDRNDFYVSPVLKSGNLLAETQSGVAELAYQLANNESVWNHLRGKVTIPKSKKNELSSDTPDTSKINLPKPFILLSGISGTGKTRFVKQQAKSDGSNYQLVPVRPDWHEPSDLLGYISRLGSQGAEYIVTDFLVFIVAAWKEVTESIAEGEINLKADCTPYWLCLDEMNLAPVEQYFADYLSIIETRKWEHGQYSCDALLNASVFEQLADQNKLRENLNLSSDDDNDLWAYFLSNGISIPPNLIVAGTVNMDETTHGFSRKVIDRAFTLDFGEFFPNDYQHYFEPVTQVKSFSFPRFSLVDLDLMSQVSIDADAQKSIKFLEAINHELKGTPFELAYRALNELLIAVVCFNPDNQTSLQAVWDDFLMTKVLPRIEGDSEKLQDDGEQSLLNKLEGILANQLDEIWGDDEKRPDLLRENTNGDNLLVQCRSKKKIHWMQKRLNDSGFTSFWP